MKKIENLLLLLRTVKNFWIVLAIFVGYRPSSLIRLFLTNGMSIYIRSRTTDFHEVISVLSGRDYPKEFIDRLMPQKPVIVNIGAHIGCFDIFIKNLRPSAHLWSYEPNQQNYALLEKNIKANHLKNVTLNRLAVGNSVGYREFYINEFNPNESSLFSDGKKTRVSCTSLATILKTVKSKRIDLLKLDCEGCEYEVLSQFPQTWDIQNVLMEYHDLDKNRNRIFILKRMKELGYQLEFHQELFESKTGILWFQRIHS